HAILRESRAGARIRRHSDTGAAGGDFVRLRGGGRRADRSSAGVQTGSGHSVGFGACCREELERAGPDRRRADAAVGVRGAWRARTAQRVLRNRGCPGAWVLLGVQGEAHIHTVHGSSHHWREPAEEVSRSQLPPRTACNEPASRLQGAEE
ncbi:hypothetical protein EV177_011077, partial [Coemansia sp. RSA 1804]